MAYMCGRCRRVCVACVGVGVRCYGVCRRVWVPCYGVCRRWRTVCMALGVRMVSVCMCRVVYVVCTLCVSFYDVVSLRRIRPNETKHLKQSINDTKRNTTNTKRMNAYSIVFKRMFT